jgi:hypothetical protein
MPRRPLPALLFVVALLLAAVPVTAAHAKVAIGIADNKSDMFTDPRFTALHVKYVRINVPYDAVHDYTERQWLDGWMAGAKQDNLKPLVTFDRSRSHTSRNPTAAQMASAIRSFRQRYPFVKEFATWNEANINKQPATVAQWWLAMRKQCPSCTILGADLLDRSNVGTWAKRFEKAAKRPVGIWGLHNYTDANRLKTTGTKTLLKAIKGKVWFTETGGVVSRNNGSGVSFPTGPAHAAKATKFVFSTLAKLSAPRVQRVYIYHWDTGVQAADDFESDRTWDSGLIGPDDQPRPALAVIQGLLGVKSS